MSARWLSELDRRADEDGRLPGGQSVGQWLGDAFQVTPNTAHSQLCEARQLRTLRPTLAALNRGEISPQHVAVICRAMSGIEKTGLDPKQTEYELIGAACDMDPHSLEQHWQQLRYQADKEAGLEAEKEQYSWRTVHLRQIPTGSYQIGGMLHPEGGATLKAALQALMGRKPAGDERSPGQRRADALVELADRALDSGELPERGGEKPHLNLVAEVSTLKLEPGSPMAQLDWGPLVTGETARRVADDAAITPVLVDGEGNVLHTGRRSRTVPAWVRKALNLRDRQCQAPSCTMPAELCTPHHLRHWADGGRSELSNLRLYCDHHHRALHPENHRFRKRGP